MPEKTRAVFLGAGASRAFGYPMTSEILPRIKQKLDAHKLFGRDTDAQSDRRDLSQYFNRMLPGWRCKDVSPPAITDVLSLIDYTRSAAIAGMLGAGPEKLARFRRLLELAICEIMNDVYEEGSWEPLCSRFVEWLVSDSENTAVITTNYDIEVEMRMFQEFSRKRIEKRFDFGYAWRDPYEDTIFPRPKDPLMRFYKLHGSLNALRCDYCEHTYINIDGPIDYIAADEDAPRRNFNSCDCGHHVLSLVLVAPSIIRDVRNIDLLQTWKNSLEWLRKASKWYIVGYSFPPEDLAIRSMLMRAYQARWDSKDKPPKVAVVQKGCDRELQSRYRIIFPDCRWISGGLKELVESSGY
jgi:hypothetical protein